jgi:hypothetical protein
MVFCLPHILQLRYCNSVHCHVFDNDFVLLLLLVFELWDENFNLKRNFIGLLLSVLVEDDECGDDAGHPAGAGEDENDKYRPAPTVKHRQRREDNG